ncbi:MAG: PAS domain-containing protein [Hyphomicrobiaceae bacterium]|nr:PAS domain-containing protein [Hyphomicrobiaceae bacterium]MCC0022975.1 PAS domain-containing protein [Hyphomicrobiaceae bacterium]
MYASWFTSPAGQKLLGLVDDQRPAWLWPRDGDQPLWANDAARLLAQSYCDEADFAPISGQIKRQLRLGLFGAASRSRIPFVACGHPVSLTCSCAPIELQNGESALLVVSVDPIEEALFVHRDVLAPQNYALLPQHIAHVIVNERGRILGGSERALDLASQHNIHDAAMWESSDIGSGLRLLVLAAEPDERAEAAEPERDLHEDWPDAEENREEHIPQEHLPQEHLTDIAEENEPEWHDEPAPEEGSGSLSRLISQFESTSTLYTPLGPEDEELPDELAALGNGGAHEFESLEAEPENAAENVIQEPAHDEDETVEAFIEADRAEPAAVEAEESAKTDSAEHAVVVDDLPFVRETAAPEPEPEAKPDIWKVIGIGPVRRAENMLHSEGTSAAIESDGVEADESIESENEAGLVAAGMSAIGAGLAGAGLAGAGLAGSGLAGAGSSGSAPVPDHEDRSGSAALQPDPETKADVDKVARYNFDELAKILNERVSGDNADAEAMALPKAVAPARAATPVALDGDLVILNRLPIGVLIFRDQDILFANRAFTQLVGCDSVDSLRALGLGRIFPHHDEGDTEAGPVLQLISADGIPVRVDARLSSMTWQTAPALVLTAQSAIRLEELPQNGAHDQSALLIKALSAARGEGLAIIDENGTIVNVDTRIVGIIGHPERVMAGRPLALFVKQADAEHLSDHMTRVADLPPEEPQVLPLEMIGGAKAHLLTLPSPSGTVTHQLVVSEPAIDPHGQTGRPDAALLNRLSRGIRRPLNTITGFSQLIETEAFGPAGNERYVDYARDISAAGRDIETLIDELDEYSQLEAGHYSSEAETFALGELLDECEAKVRHQASVRQVFVRSAVSEKLPKISADRQSMRKALLNVLASAIDQSVTGGKVILSAQYVDDGSIAVHVRDSGTAHDELADRFSVFREEAGKRMEEMVPLKSSMGLALTRSLLAVNSCSLNVSPASGTGTLMTLEIPHALIVADSAN